MVGRTARPSIVTRAGGDDPQPAPEQFAMVMCADASNPADPKEWWRSARLAERRAPHLGAALVYNSLACATWPAVDDDRYTGPWNRPTANPVLVIGNRRGDPATPYEDAESTARELGRARLLTYDGWGHTAQGGLSRCIDAAVDRYFISLRLPRRGTLCKPDHPAFRARTNPR